MSQIVFVDVLESCTFQLKYFKDFDQVFTDVRESCTSQIVFVDVLESSQRAI